MEKRKNCYSIIIPVYNSEKYIFKCLDSLINQTYDNLDIVVVNDGSSDNSLEICKNFEKSDKRVRVFNQENKGVSVARNRGIEEAMGDFIVFVDSDDWIENNTIEIVNNEIENNNIDMVMYGIMTSGKKNKGDNLLITQKYNEELSKMIISESLNAPVNKIYNLKILKEFNIRFKEKIDIAEDLLFNYDYFIHINSILIVNKDLYHCCTDNKQSLTRKYTTNKYEQLMEVNEIIEKDILQNNRMKLLKSIKYIRIKNIFSCIMDLTREQCMLTKEEKYKFIKKMQKENKIGIIFGNGIKPFVYSCVYNIIRSPELLLYIAKLINRK